MTWEPADALRRIAFLLERTLESQLPGQGVPGGGGRARRPPTDDVRAAGRTAGLRDRRGSARRPAMVVEASVAGEEPGVPRRPGGHAAGAAAPRAARRCGPPCAATCTCTPTGPTAARRSRRWRSPRSSSATSTRPDRPLAAADGGQRAVRRAADASSSSVVDGDQRRPGRPFRLLTGIEVDILDDGELDQTAEMLGAARRVVASVHSKLRMARRAMTRRMVAAVANPRTNVLGHCTGRLVMGGRGTRGRRSIRRGGGVRRLRGARRRGRDQLPAGAPRPAGRLVELALDAGCLFTIDTDAHAPGQLDFKPGLRARRAPRRPGRADRHHLAGRAGPGVGFRAVLSRATAIWPPGRHRLCFRSPRRIRALLAGRRGTSEDRRIGPHRLAA